MADEETIQEDAPDLLTVAKLIAERLDDLRVSLDNLADEVFEIKEIMKGNPYSST